MFSKTASVRSNRNTISFIQVTPGQEQDDAYAKKMRKENAMRNTVIEPLTSVPFPPEISVHELLEPSKDSKRRTKPPNKFFIFRKVYTREINRQGKRYPQTMLSHHLKILWKILPEEQKLFYNDMAEEARTLFKEKYGANYSTAKASKRNNKGKERKPKQPRHVPQVASPPHTDDDMAHYSPFLGGTFSFLSMLESIEDLEQLPTPGPADNVLSDVQLLTTEDFQSNREPLTPSTPMKI